MARGVILSDAVMKYLEGYRLALIEDQIAKGMRVTGRSAESLKSHVKGFGGTLTGADYWLFQEEGRRPGKMPPIDAIKKWIADRGLTLNAYAVAKGIAKKGTRIHQGLVPGIDVSKKADVLRKQLVKDVSKGYTLLIIKTMKDAYKTI